MNEADTLPSCLASLLNQSETNYHIYICVNQPDNYWDMPNLKPICINNQKTIQYLTNIQKTQNLPITIIDNTTKGNGWKNVKCGVGIARKTCMDFAAKNANNNDILLSLDADTFYPKNYLKNIAHFFKTNTEYKALSVPYYHKTTSNTNIDRGILLYEIYARNYFINLYHIQSPYTFTALGSGIALPVDTYKTIGGITPKQSGEDFYFLQQLAKYGKISNKLNSIINPASRFSERIIFGTGQAIKQTPVKHDAYPLFFEKSFLHIKYFFEALPNLYLYNTIPENSFFSFLSSIFKKNDFYIPIKNNSKTYEQFEKAMHTKCDALKIYQYIRHDYTITSEKTTDTERLMLFINQYYPKFLPDTNNLNKNFSLINQPIETLKKIRKSLFIIEMNLRNN